MSCPNFPLPCTRFFVQPGKVSAGRAGNPLLESCIPGEKSYRLVFVGCGAIKKITAKKHTFWDGNTSRIPSVSVLSGLGGFCPTVSTSGYVQCWIESLGFVKKNTTFHNTNPHTINRKGMGSKKQLIAVSQTIQLQKYLEKENIIH